MLANEPTRSIRTAPIYDAATAVTQLLGISRATLFAWLSGDATPPSHVRISPDLIAFVGRGIESSQATQFANALNAVAPSGACDAG